MGGWEKGREHADPESCLAWIQMITAAVEKRGENMQIPIPASLGYK
jgi:hypothetical protein